MTIFAETLSKAISDYRALLRRYLEQADRVKKLRELKIRGTFDSTNEPELYEIGCNIVNDIKRRLGRETQGETYYAYSGVQKFGECLKEFLDQYIPRGNIVVHKAQQSARAVLLGVQLVGLPPSQLSGEISSRLRSCAEDVLAFGSIEQKRNFKRLLEIGKERTPEFYTTLFENYTSRVGVLPEEIEEDDEDFATEAA